MRFPFRTSSLSMVIFERIMSNQQQALLGRTSLQPGESLQSLLIRLTQLNYHGSPNILSLLLREGIGEQERLLDRVMLPRQPAMYQRIAGLTTISIADIHASSAHRFAEILTSPEHAFEFLELSDDMFVPLLAKAHAAKQLRPAHAGQFCPLCLKEAIAYHRLIWMPLAVSACLKHACLLVSRCQTCTKTVSIWDIVETQCLKCGSDLTKAEVLSLEDDLGLRFQEILQSWFTTDVVSESALCLFPKQSPRVLYQVVDGLQWAMRVLEGSEWSYQHSIQARPLNQVSEQNKGQRTLTPYESYCLFTTASKGIMNWPTGFYEFLQAYRFQRQQEKHSSGGPKADMGNLYTQWLQDYWKHPTFEFVQNAFQHYFTNTYTLSSATIRTNLCQEHPDVMEQLSFVNITEAARLLGTTTKMIDILLRTGRLTCQASGSISKRKHRFVSRTEVLELRNTWNELFNCTEAASRLGITEQLVVDLVKVGLLVAEHNPKEGYPSWMFSKSALIECIEKVSQHIEGCLSRDVDEKDNFIDLPSAARLLFVIGLNSASILLHVAEHDLRAYYVIGQEIALGSLLFDRVDIDYYKCTIKAENGWIDRKELTKLLKVKDTTLARWVTSGLISPKIICGNAQYFDREIVEKFLTENIFTDEAARILDIGKLTVQKWARQGRLSSSCISGPTLDGHHAYLFNKEKLTHWRGQRLTFGEALQILGISKAMFYRKIKEGKVTPLGDMGGKQCWFFQQAIIELRDSM